MSCIQCGKTKSSNRWQSNWCRECGMGSSKKTHKSHKSHQSTRTYQKPRVQQRQPLSFRQSQIKKQEDNYLANPFVNRCIVSPFSYAPQMYTRRVSVQIPRIGIVNYPPQCIVVKRTPVRRVIIGNRCSLYGCYQMEHFMMPIAMREIMRESNLFIYIVINK